MSDFRSLIPQIIILIVTYHAQQQLSKDFILSRITSENYVDSNYREYYRWGVK